MKKSIKLLLVLTLIFLGGCTSSNENEGLISRIRLSFESENLDYSIKGIEIVIQDNAGFIIIPNFAVRSQNQEIQMIQSEIKIDNELIFSGSVGIDREETDLIHKDLVSFKTHVFNAKQINVDDNTKVILDVKIRTDSGNFSEQFTTTWKFRTSRNSVVKPRSALNFY